MKTPRHEFVKRLRLPRSAHEAFAWHEQPGALTRLIPPTDPVKLVQHHPGKQGLLGDGARVILAIGHFPVRIQWVAVHEGFVQDRRFIDVQKKGPFAFWRHTHTFTPESTGSCYLEDKVEYSLPLGWLGDAVAHSRLRAQIEKMFAWRHRVTYEELSR